MPTATYRLQLQPRFDFDAAAAAVPYLASLGVSHLHLSPILQATPGSTHGYDVVDHGRVSADLGGEAGLRRLAGAARAHGLGLVVDCVPNHMAVPVPQYLSAPLWGVLRDGPTAPSARWFDVDWSVPGGRMLLPVLRERLAAALPELRVDVLGAGEARAHCPAGTPVLRYHDHVLPLRPGTEGLPLAELLDRQWYRLAWWRLGRTELNYRRFFTITSLIGLRVEDPEVFAATHATLLRLVAEGLVDGLRIDHPDGLADPRGYLRRLAEAAGGRWTVVEKILTGEERLPRDWPCAGTTGYDVLRRIDGLFVDQPGVRRITEHYRCFTDEARGADDGARFEDVARRATRQVVTEELAAEVGRLTRLATRICQEEPLPAPPGAPERPSPAAGPTSGAVARPAGTPRRVCLRDHAPSALRTAVEELLVALPVYRPYVVPGEPAPARSALLLERAADPARYAFPTDAEAEAVDVVVDLALGRLGRSPAKDEFVARFAQTASATAAKGVEDTAFYRWVPLLSVNEVGGSPEDPGVLPSDFHAYCGYLQRDWPVGMTTLSTHDTKRSADARARLAVLAEVPEVWRRVCGQWAAASRRHLVGGLPDRHTQYLVWQTLLAAWPVDEERLTGTVLKSLREAKTRTTWTERDEVFEQAVVRYVRALLADPAFTGPDGAVGQLVERLRPAERCVALGALLVQLTMPGVPDVYQGGEGELRTLVDPDNRRPVDFAALRERLERLDGPGAADGTDVTGGTAPPGPPEGADLGTEKHWVTARALRLRRRRPEWFGPDSSYLPLHGRGPRAAHLTVFSRAERVITAVTRLPERLERAGGWEDTELPLPWRPSGGSWTDLLTGRAYPGGAAVRVADLFARLPVALLVADGGDAHGGGDAVGGAAAGR
ncbi:(1-_4)-alpha-D-glucan 1-alpha-D-glucosylmutase [Allostreptomyces psammosilenae]|uniref:(1->4)-alpha-D-glucan 1-alpha-D-glucosylmutase n=1 Tax=Allostreptomyces psammosilenae TaxID=1892865 RepID=A0A852ZP53_9ACTN|nr:(1->4)-alpha-D-glucan 1-alpha-D-glucosylmutase [Allostreptomyces psammosilenae]